MDYQGLELVPIGTPVQIVNQPIKLGWLGNHLFIELHPPLEEEKMTITDYNREVDKTIYEFLEKTSNDTKGGITKNIRIDQKALETAITEWNGIPRLITEEEK
jgi:L,D-transpeptidase ErfK/SrfK